MAKLKIGIIGCGGIANGKHMPSLSTCADAEMVAFCDIIVERAKAAAEKFGIPGAAVYEDYHELLAREDIDVVHVLTPNHMHAEISIAALKAGKHVMCEKPMAKTAAEAKAMVEAAKESGRKLSIGYQTRSDPAYQVARRLIKSGAIGDVYYVKAPSLRRRGVPTWGVFLDKEKQGGGPMIDIGTHSIDAALFVIGNYDVESVTGSVNYKLADEVKDNGWGMWKPGEFTVEDSAMGFIKFKNGCTMYVEASWALNFVTGSCPTFCGTKGGIELRGGKVYLNGERANLVGEQKCFEEEYQPTMNDHDKFKGEKLNNEQYEAHSWIDSILNDTPQPVQPEEAYTVSRIIEAIYESAKTGKTIYFD